MVFLNRDNTESSKGVSSYPIDFDLAFAEPSPPGQTLHVPEGAQPWLDLWVLQNPRRLPSQKEATSLAVLTGACEAQIMAWINRRLSRTNRLEFSDIVEPPDTMPKAYRPKCIDSRWRYRYRGPQEEVTKTFECTHRCGQSFPRQRKGDWARHERVNFEEWICPMCHGVLSRREKLRDHLRDFHGACDTVREAHRHLTLRSIQRPCGFCQRRLQSWAEWLTHVSAHFEGLLPGGTKTMAQWSELEPSDDARAMDVDAWDTESVNCLSELSQTPSTTTNTTNTTDSGFFSYATPSITSTDAYRSRLWQGRNSTGPGHQNGRIAPPILENPQADIYNAPDATPGQPYAFPDPENQWSLQTMQSLLGCWMDGQS
jgi:hypothetical protein